MGLFSCTWPLRADKQMTDGWMDATKHIIALLRGQFRWDLRKWEHFGQHFSRVEGPIILMVTWFLNFSVSQYVQQVPQNQGLHTQERKR